MNNYSAESLVKFYWENDSVSFDDAIQILVDDGFELPKSWEDWYDFSSMEFQRCACCQRAWYGEKENVLHDNRVVRKFGRHGFDYLCIECENTRQSKESHEQYYFDEKEFLPLGYKNRAI